VHPYGYPPPYGDLRRLELHQDVLLGDRRELIATTSGSGLRVLREVDRLAAHGARRGRGLPLRRTQRRHPFPDHQQGWFGACLRAPPSRRPAATRTRSSSPWTGPAFLEQPREEAGLQQEFRSPSGRRPRRPPAAGPCSSRFWDWGRPRSGARVLQSTQREGFGGASRCGEGTTRSLPPGSPPIRVAGACGIAVCRPPGSTKATFMTWSTTSSTSWSTSWTTPWSTAG
jgi:hypothetical protein